MENLLYLIITAIVCGLLFLPLYFGATEVLEIIGNTVYPGSRESFGGGNWGLLFSVCT